MTMFRLCLSLNRTSKWSSINEHGTSKTIVSSVFITVDQIVISARNGLFLQLMRGLELATRMRQSVSPLLQFCLIACELTKVGVADDVIAGSGSRRIMHRHDDLRPFQVFPFCGHQKHDRFFEDGVAGTFQRAALFRLHFAVLVDANTDAWI